MNTRAFLLALLSTIILAQPLLLPLLAKIRRWNSSIGWFLMTLLPALAFHAILSGFVAGWEDAFRPATAVATGELSILPPISTMFTGVAPILALCALPSALFAGLAFIDGLDRRREEKRLAVWRSLRAAGPLGERT